MSESELIDMRNTIFSIVMVEIVTTHFGEEYLTTQIEKKVAEIVNNTRRAIDDKKLTAIFQIIEKEIAANILSKKINPRQ